MSPPSHSPQPNIQTTIAETGFSVRFWLLVVLTGICAGLSGGLLMKLLHAVQQAAWSYSSGSFLRAVEESSTVRRVACLLGAGLLAGVVRGSLRRTFGQAGGELSETIRLRSGRFSTAPAITRGLLSIIIVGLGASLGREGALKQAGAAIRARLSAWGGLPISQTRLLAAYGARAGMAAAYNVPCGGALFALEVLLGGLSLPLVVPALAASSIATLVSWLLLPNRPAYAVPDYSLSATQVAWAFVAGPFSGSPRCRGLERLLGHAPASRVARGRSSHRCWYSPLWEAPRFFFRNCPAMAKTWFRLPSRTSLVWGCSWFCPGSSS